MRGSKTPTKPKIPLHDSFSKRGNDPIVSARKVLTNLPDRKKTVLKIATENFDLVRRLERVKSAFQTGVLSTTPISHSHRESLKKAYHSV